MQKGRYIFLDIGKGETKIIEAVARQHSVTILRTAEMRDMSLFVSDKGTIRQIEGFCTSLKRTLDEAEIKSTNVILCSSIFDFKHKDLTEEFKTIKTCGANFDKTYGRATDFSVINDWQYFGDQVFAKEIKQVMYMTTGQINLLKSFVTAMRNVAGLTVLSIESSMTAASNLQYLYNASYDLPSVALVDLGKDTTHIQFYKNGTLVNFIDMESSLYELPAELASKFDLPMPKLMNLLYNIGLNDTEKNRAALATATIDPEEFFSRIQEHCKQFCLDLQRTITSTAASKRLENVQVVFTGGYVTMPGFSELLQRLYTLTPCTVLEVDNIFATKTFKIVNKSNRLLSAKYTTCLGLTLKNFNSQHTINLLPKELMVVDSGKVISNVLTVLCAATILAGASVVGFKVPDIIDLYKLSTDNNNLSSVDSDFIRTQAECSKLSNYIDNIKNINSTLTPFVNFLTTCESDNLKIATVDTANILGIQIAKTDDSGTEDGIDAKSTSNPLEHIIVRGYAKTSDDITAFYTKLSNNDSVLSVNMNGIREVNLSTDTEHPDFISLFEMEVQVSD